MTVLELHYAIILKEPRPALSYAATVTIGAAAPLTLQWPAQAGTYRAGVQTVSVPIETAGSGWKLEIAPLPTPADFDLVKDILFVARYAVTL